MNRSREHELLLDQIVSEAAEHFDQAELFELDTRELSGGYRAGHLRQLAESRNTGICLRILKEGRIAQASTSNMEAARMLVDRVKNLVRFGERVEFEFPQPSGTPHTWRNDPAEIDIDIMDIVSSGREMVDKIKAFDPGVIPHASAQMDVTSIRILNSNGIDQSYSARRCSTGVVGILASEGNILQTYTYHLGRSFPDRPDELADHTIWLLKIGRKNIPFTGSVLPILFTPKAFADILAAFGSGISGSMVSRGMSPLTGKIGEKILNPGVTIIDDGRYPGGYGSQPFDDEGVPCEEKHLVENGVLKRFIFDLKTAAKMGEKPSGNGFRYTALIKSRSYIASPGPAFTNLIIPGGARTCEDILRDHHRILYVDQLTGVLLGNLINGDWSGNIEYGVLFELGEPVGRIKNAMTGGNFYQQFKSQFIEFSSNRMWVAGFGGGSGSSLIPYVLIDGMNISA
ncbi:TldD/PmbA family protein [bacterium]|nr:TldD/PmbA family protein [candidate division CSSED10-310 bacterium]